MSFSFNIRGSTKDEIVTKVIEEMAKVVASQPVHSADQDLVVATTKSYLGLLSDPAEGMEYHAAIFGSVGKPVDAEALTSAGGSVTVNHAVIQK